MSGKVVEGEMANKTPAAVWIPALCFSTVLLCFFLAAFFTTPNFTDSQREVVSMIFPLLAGFATFFMGGAVLLQITGKTAAGVDFAISATAGVAVFILCYLHPPPAVKKFLGYELRPTLDFATIGEEVVEESKRVQSATIYTGQNGDTKGTQVEIELPPGAFGVTSTTDWTCNCSKRSRSETRGNKVIAEGSITSPEKLFGPRVWGELWLEVHWKRKVQKPPVFSSITLNPTVIYSTDVSYPIAQGIPQKARIEFRDNRKTICDVVEIARDLKDSEPARQTSMNGLFVATLSAKQLQISVVPH